MSMAACARTAATRLIRAFHCASAALGMPEGPDAISTITLDDVKRALILPGFDSMSAQLRMAPKPRPIRRQERMGQPRLASVLMLLYPVDGELTFPLMRRPE